jgi:hypothetical protein
MTMKCFVKSVSIVCVTGPLVLGWILHTAAQQDAGYYLNYVNPDYVVTPEEAYEWHAAKDAMGPTYSGSASWKNFLTIVETKLKEYGAVDLVRNAWTYDRWHTSDWPDDTSWGLVSAGDPVKVAHYGAYSGSTGQDGVTAALVYYDAKDHPRSIEGKIVVFSTVTTGNIFSGSDYEYLSDPDTLPEFGVDPPVSDSVTMDMFWQLVQTRGFIDIIRKGNAAGAIFVFDASYNRIAGLYTFPVPAPYDTPTLFLDREAGRKVVEDAKNGQTATLKLVAKVEPAETYQLIGYLPGKNYGTVADEMIALGTHTDGPAVCQDNGAFGLLGIVHYFSHIPRSERPRTLLIFLDNRHYMPGMERTFAREDWFAKHPEALDSIVAHVTTEHLGEVEYRELGNVFEPTGRAEISFLYASNNQLLIDKGIQAIKDNRWPRVIVQCVGRNGVHGKRQGPWFGLGRRWAEKGLPGFASGAGQGAYWATTARIDRFDKNLFCTQVAAMAQLTGELMVADLKSIANESGATSDMRPHYPRE